MSLKVQVERKLDVTVMKFAGRVTLGEGAIRYREAVRELVWNGHKKLALDYGDISYEDSSGIGEMVAAYTIVRNSGGELVLFDLGKGTRDRLQITKLFTVFDVFESLASALAHFDSSRKRETLVRERRYGPVSVLEIQGAITEQDGAGKVLESTELALSAGSGSVVVLCPQVLSIDRCGADVLASARERVRRDGGDLVLAGVEERLMPAVAEWGIPERLPVCKNLDDALKRFGLTIDRSKWRIEVTGAR
jgi:anti-sigma B factor antagonist